MYRFGLVMWKMGVWQINLENGWLVWKVLINYDYIVILQVMNNIVCLLKSFCWIGFSYEDFMEFLVLVYDVMGYVIYCVQEGKVLRYLKVFKGV